MLTLSRNRTYITECTLYVSQVLLLLPDYFWYIYIQWLSKALCLKRYLVTYCTIIIALNYINVYFTKCDVKIPETSSTQVHVYGIYLWDWSPMCICTYVIDPWCCIYTSVIYPLSCVWFLVFLCLIGQDCPCCPDKLDSQKAASLPKKLLTGVYKIFRRSRTLPVA